MSRVNQSVGTSSLAAEPVFLKVAFPPVGPPELPPETIFLGQVVANRLVSMLMRWPLVYVVLLFTVVQQASSQGVAVKSVSNNAIQQAYDSTLKVTVPEALYDAAASWYTNFLVDLIVDIPDDSQWAC